MVTPKRQKQVSVVEGMGRLPGKTTYGVCPQGHELPHIGPGGSCTAMYCSSESLNARQQAERANVLFRKHARQHAPGQGIARIEKEENMRVAFDKARKKVRDSLVEQPKTVLAGEEAESWADSKLVKLLPAAVAEVEYQLNYGDDKQRMEAADRVLKATGRSNRDAGVGGGQTIVLNISSAELPWKKATVINAQVTNGVIEGSQKTELPSGGVERGGGPDKASS